MSAAALFQQLAKPDEWRYQCTPLKAHRLARDWLGRPCLVISATYTGRRATELRHLSIEHGRPCRAVGQHDEPRESSIVTMTTADPDLEAVFLEAAEPLLDLVGPRPSDVDVAEAFVSLSALLSLGEGTLPGQGLWAEMLVMAESEDPVAAVEAWHAGVTDLLDFNWSGTRLEVKSTRSTQRLHHFRLEQLRPPGGQPPLVASVLLEAGGQSLEELASELRARCALRPELRLKIDAVLLLCRDPDAVRFDRAAGRRTLRFYRGADIACPTAAPNVSDVRFIVALDASPNVPASAVPTPFRPAAAA